MVKLHNAPNDNSICVNDMQDGQIAIITEWPTMPKYVGDIVQKHGSRLITIGAESGQTFSDVFKDREETHRVRILQKGELIEIC